MKKDISVMLIFIVILLIFYAVKIVPTQITIHSHGTIFAHPHYKRGINGR